MARARLVSEKISRSIRINKLPETAQLLFTWMILHLDAEGRMTGEPRLVNRIVFPLKDYTDDQVKEWLDLMEAQKDPETGHGLIEQYEVEEHKFLWMPGFDSEQSSRGGKSWKAKEYPLPGPFGHSDIPTPPSKRGAKPLSKAVPVHIDKGIIPTVDELDLQEVIKTFPGWEFQEAEDLAWLRSLTQDFPNISVANLKACRDYHSDKPTATGPWKNRIRQWLTHESKFKEKSETHQQKSATADRLKEGAK